MHTVTPSIFSRNIAVQFSSLRQLFLHEPEKRKKINPVNLEIYWTKILESERYFPYIVKSKDFLRVEKFYVIENYWNFLLTTNRFTIAYIGGDAMFYFNFYPSEANSASAVHFLNFLTEEKTKENFSISSKTILKNSYQIIEI